jgi:hypothetical protein
MSTVNHSIHPRNWYQVDKTWPKGEKQNTAKSRNPESRGALGKREKNLNHRRNAMVATMSKPANATSFRMPGSMRGW